MAEQLDIEGGLGGIQPPDSTPIPNKADAAWERLQELRVQARGYVIEVDDAWPIARLEEEIAAFVERLPKHEPDCALVITRHLTCTCGAFRRTVA